MQIDSHAMQMGTQGAEIIRHFPRFAKYKCFIGFQPVLVLTDNQAINSWTREILEHSQWSIWDAIL